MTATPAHAPHPGMTATTGPYLDRRWHDTETPWCVILATPGRGIYQHYHFASEQEASLFHEEWKP